MTSTGAPPHVRATLMLENAAVLDGQVKKLEPTMLAAFGSGTRGSILRGDWLGHALHPILTDLVLGTWTSATVLDVAGGRDAQNAAAKLVGTGLLAFGPTAWTGWAEWSQTGIREKRIGLVHATTNAVAAGLYAASWVARKRGRHAGGAQLALVGASVTGLGGYLGGHLASARKVGTRHPAFADGSPSEVSAQPG